MKVTIRDLRREVKDSDDDSEEYLLTDIAENEKIVRELKKDLGLK